MKLIKTNTKRETRKENNNNNKVFQSQTS
uniref:Uncharacterized protein n=1 Tax=Arundo donax TaxID=35708 RepID=A0A0A9EEE9_ARUDO